MKKLSLTAIIAAAMIFSACNGNTSTSTTTDSTTATNNSNAVVNNDTTSGNSMNKDTGSAMVGSDATEFAQEAATGGMMEVQLGQIAQKNGASAAVKDFGKMMVEDHTKLNDQLKDLASRKNVTLPTAVTNEQQNEIDKLSKETGKDFDKDYVSMMVDDHQKDIDKFKNARDKISDADFKELITKALPVLEKHLNAIQQIKKNM